MDAAARRLLAALADELERARASVEPLADLVSDHVRRLPPQDRDEVLPKAQGVDLLAQRLESLAVFARAIAAGQPAAAASQAVTLAEVAGRLQAACGLEGAQPSDARSGDLDLFD